MTIRILLADDQTMVRVGFRMILEAEGDIDIVGEAPDGAQAVAATQRFRPDVVLMDVQMPNTDGLEATRLIVADPGLDSRVVVLTTFERDDYIFTALQAGASGFLLKNAPPEDLARAVRTVAAGDALFAPSITRRIIQEYARRHPARRRDTEDLERLSDRETEVLRLLAAGKSNAELAGMLYLAESTIKTHVSRVLTKLDLRDRVQAVVYAYENGVVSPGHTQCADGDRSVNQ